MAAERAEAAALKLLAAVAKAEGIDLGKKKAGWSPKEILDAYRECLASVTGRPQRPTRNHGIADPPVRRHEAREAWQNVIARNKFARWSASENPKRIQNSAALRLRSPIFLPAMSPKFKIRNSDVIFCIGSCFARNIESALTDFGLDCASIPSAALQDDGLQSETLTKFSAASILTELRWALDPATPFQESFLLAHEDGTFSDPHSRHGVSHASREHAMAARGRVIQAMREILRADIVILTLGLVEAWYDNELEIYLNEAPIYLVTQQNFQRFSLHVLDYPRNMRALQRICELLATLPRHPKILLTVSPVPFMSTFSDKDVVVANTYSKATLRAVVEDVAARDAAIDYVPVFEAVVNSRVDLAWERDRIHVTDLAVRANVLHFLANYLADPVKSAQAASALRLLLGGDPAAGQRNRNVPLPDFEFAMTDPNAFPAGLPQISASSEMALNYGAQFLGAGPSVPWHAKSPVGYPQTISVSFREPLTPKALWLQAQDHHFDRAPCKFSVYGCNSAGERHLLLQSLNKPSWDFTGWASWRFRDTNAYARFEIVIEDNCGNPELLTLQRLWFEPAPPATASKIVRFREA
jgi:hypothetical protein